MTTVNEDNNADKTKLPSEFIFGSLSSVCYPQANSMSKLIHNRCTCKLIMKTTAAYVHAQELASVF